MPPISPAPVPGFTTRVGRHLKLTMRALERRPSDTPPLLILFINSICNLTCEHCFYWRNLNRRDDLTFEEIDALSRELGRVENLNLSGGEPFLRPDFAEVCHLFLERNGTRLIYVPTSGFFRDRTLKAVRACLEHAGLWYFVCELSLDGTEPYHNRFRGSDQAFGNAMDTYDALVELQDEDPRLRVHAISTVTSENLDEVRELSRYLYDRCPRMDHHNLALIRGDRKNPSLQGPALESYGRLADELATRWRPREQGRFGGIVDPLLHWAKMETARQQTQVIPCRAGVVSGVVYANGDVSVCETHEPLGNLRQRSFRDIWFSPEAQHLRESIAARECYCTNEVFLWPSVTFQPRHLLRAVASARPWQSRETSG